MTEISTSLEDLRAELESNEVFLTPPIVLQNILAVTEDPNAGAKDVQSAVEQDLSCSARLLRLANSAYYGFSRQVKSVKEAVVIIGLEAVKSVAMSLGVAENFTQGSEWQCEFLKKLWVHSMATATGAEMLARGTGEIKPPAAYCAGLMHDFGKVILCHHDGEKYQRIVELAEEHKLHIAGVEQSLLGVNHSVVGNWIGESWDLPLFIQEVLVDHHTTSPYVESKRGVFLIQLADTLAYRAEIGHGGNYGPTSMDQAILESMGITTEQTEAVVEEIKKQSDRFLALLAMAETA